MNPGLIVLIVCLSILTLFLILCIMDIVFVMSFNKLFATHTKSMILFLNMKYDNIKKLLELMIAYKVKVDRNLVIALNDIHREDFDHIESKACVKAQNILTYTKDELLYIARGLSDIRKHEEFKMAVENVSTLETQYRNTIASYNADVLGYNYWISFWPTRWIWKMFKIKKRNLMMN